MWGAEAWGSAPWGAIVDAPTTPAGPDIKGPIGLVAHRTPPTALQASAAGAMALTARATPTVSIIIGLEVPDV